MTENRGIISSFTPASCCSLIYDKVVSKIERERIEV